jgi:hypothetical protein
MTVALYLVAGAAWVVFSYRPPDNDVSGAEQAGQMIGSLVGTLLIALLLRLVYVKLLRRRDAIGFWSPWIFVIAAFLGLFALIGNVAERESDPENREASAFVETSTGSRSAAVEECLFGALDEYDSAPSDHPTKVAFARGEFKEIVLRACQKAEARDLFDEELSPEELAALLEETIAEMERSGELSPPDG